MGSSESHHPNLIITLSLIQNKTTFEPETQFKPQDKIYIEWPQFALTNNRFKRCPYVQDTDEKLAPLGQNFKELRLIQSHWKLPKTKINLTNPSNKPEKP